MRGQATRAWIGWYERRPWTHRIIGYWNGDRLEGIHQPLIEGWLFDHSPVMLAKWRAFLREKYKTVETLRATHGVPDANFETYDTPRDRNRGPVPVVERLPFWPSEAAVRDYLELTRDLYHARLRRLAADTAAATLGRKHILYGSTLSYGPVLVPRDGDRLGEAWLHRGLLRSGLSVKTFGRGAGRWEVRATGRRCLPLRSGCRHRCGGSRRAGPARTFGAKAMM